MGLSFSALAPLRHFSLRTDFIIYYYSGTDAAVSSKKPVDHSVASGEDLQIIKSSLGLQPSGVKKGGGEDMGV